LLFSINPFLNVLAWYFITGREIRYKIEK